MRGMIWLLLYYYWVSVCANTAQLVGECRESRTRNGWDLDDIGSKLGLKREVVNSIRQPVCYL